MITADFLLRTPTARRLYHGSVAGLPIIDYHNHLDPGALADDRPFENLTRLWIANDPYKHRAMRIVGVAEHLITGPSDDRARFDAWAATLPQTIGNPIFHWSALELLRHFDITLPLSPSTSARIWDECAEKLRSPEFTPRRILARAGAVERVFTSDPPDADLDAHARLARSGFATRIAPSPRFDEPPAPAPPGSAPAFDRLDDFARLGCTIADLATTRFDRDILVALGQQCVARGWTLQLHIGAQRHTSSRLRDLAGPAGGYATIGAPLDVAALCRALDEMERHDAFPRTILYPLNPADFAPVATLTGSFTGAGVRSKLQLGPAWWYNDHADGIRRHLDALAAHGILSAFVGMTTDSRSLLSMTRHEYFRRVLCDWIGERVAAGAFPDDPRALEQLARAICYGNAREWFTPISKPA